MGVKVACQSSQKLHAQVRSVTLFFDNNWPTVYKYLYRHIAVSAFYTQGLIQVIVLPYIIHYYLDNETHPI